MRLKKITILILLVIILFSLFPSYVKVNADENNRTVVRVGYVEIDNMMEGMSDDAEKSGLGYEYIQKVSYYTNWDYEYVYGDWDTILEKLYNGEIDILAGVSKNDETQQKILFPEYSMGSENYYLGVAKNRTDLLNQLNCALSKISSTDPNFTRRLTDKYLLDVSVNTQMQEDELKWIDEHKTIYIGYMKDYMPFSDCTKNGKATGIITDIMDEILKVLDIQGKIKLRYVAFNKNKDMIKALNSGKIDVAFPVEDNVSLADKNKIFLTSSVITTSMNLAFKGDYDEGDTKTIAVRKGNTLQEEYTHTHYPNAKILYYDTFEESLNAVMSGKAGSIIINDFRKDGYLNNTRYKELNTAQLPDTSSRCLAVNAGENELLSILNRGITNLPENYSITAIYKYIGRLADYTVEDYVNDHYLLVIILVAVIIAVICGFVAYIVNSKSKRDILYEMAHKDSMTGIFNRRAFDEKMDGYGKSIVGGNMMILMMDLNGLKKVNDTLGHEAGDEMIEGAAGCMKRILSPYGEIYRTGGDEFVAIINIRKSEQNKLIKSLNKSFSEWKGKICDSLSVSIGYYYCDDESKLTMKDLMLISDQRLYKQKDIYYNKNKEI